MSTVAVASEILQPSFRDVLWHSATLDLATQLQFGVLAIACLLYTGFRSLSLLSASMIGAEDCKNL